MPEMYEAIIDSTHILVAYMDARFNFIRVNKAYAQANEKERSFFPGKNHFDLYPDEENRRIFQKVVETGIPFFISAKPCEYPGHPERGIRYRDWRLVPQKDGEGRVISLVLTLQNATDRVKAEEALRVSEESFRKIFEEAHLGIVITSPSFVFEKANPAFCRMMGYSADELRSMTFADITHPDHLKQDMENVKKVGRGEILFYQTEKRYINKSGKVLWGDLIVSTIRDKHGALQYYLSMVNDITVRKLAEEALRNSRDELRVTLDATTDGIWTWNFKTNEFFFSPRYYTMLGYEPNEFQASFESWQNLIHPDDRESALTTANRWLETQTHKYANEFRLRTKTGDYRWIRTAGVVVERDASGQAVRMIGNHEDITVRKLAAEELLESGKQWNDTFEAIDSGICIIDMDRRIVKCNEAMCRLTKKPKKTVIGDTCCKLVHKRKSPIPNCPFTKMCSSGKIESYEFQLGDAWINEIAYPLYDNRGVIKGAVHIFRDTTAQKEYDRSLERKNIALKEVLSQVEEEKSRIKDDVAYNIRELVLPLLQKIKKEAAHSKSVTVLEASLHKIASSFGRTISTYKENFTPREIEICNQIRSGIRSKGIAEILGTSRQTVEKQRKIIRKKLGIKDKSVNLVAFLQNIDGKRDI